MTATRPAYRGRGLARWVKQRMLNAVAAAGVTSATTANDATNAPMIAVNDALGLHPRRADHPRAAAGDPLTCGSRPSTCSSGRTPGEDHVDAGRFAAAVASLDADVLALQEVDRGQPRSGYVDLAGARGRGGRRRRRTGSPPR